MTTTTPETGVTVDGGANHTITLGGSLAMHTSIPANVSLTAGPHFPNRCRLTVDVDGQRVAQLDLTRAAVCTLAALVDADAATADTDTSDTDTHPDHQPAGIDIDATNILGRAAKITFHATATDDTGVPVTLHSALIDPPAAPIPLHLRLPRAALQHLGPGIDTLMRLMTAVEVTGTDDARSSPTPTTMHVVGPPALTRSWLVAITRERQPAVRLHLDREGANRLEETLWAATTHYTSNASPTNVPIPAVDEYGRPATLTVTTHTEHGQNVTVTVLGNRADDQGRDSRRATIVLPYRLVLTDLAPDLAGTVLPDNDTAE